MSATSPTQEKLDSARMASLIAKRHSGRSQGDGTRWAVFYELRDGTGFTASGQALDVFAVDCWPSGNFTRVAYEIKVSRNDFLRELKNPNKRAFGMGISNEFWFAAPPGVAKPAEIPEGLGLLELRGSKLVAVVHAKHRVAVEWPVEVIALLRAAQSATAKLTSGMHFQHAGRTLTVEDFDRILTETRPYAEQRAIDAKAKELTKLGEQRLRDALAAYATALKIAGVEPPIWMTDLERLDRWGTWQFDARDWVDTHVVPKRDEKALARYAKDLRDVATEATHAADLAEARLQPK